MTDLYDILETCLNEIEQGADVDTVLFRYPEFADELRPILETSAQLKAKAVPAPSAEVVRRNRAKVLQHASEMRERKAAPLRRRIWSPQLRSALAALMVVFLFLLSGTGLVRASSTTLPGDDLYPVKRSWESVQLFFTFNADARETLELEHENERLEEVTELFAMGRTADVDFSGYVTRQTGDEWLVSGIPVLLSSQTRLPDGPVRVGDAVRVRGQARDGGVAALRIDLLSSNPDLPEIENGNDSAAEQPENSNEQVEQESGSGSDNDAPPVLLTVVPTPTAKPQKVTLEGVVTSLQDKLIVVNGVVMDIKTAEVKGTPAVGAVAKAEGSFDASGIFIVTKIEFKSVAATVTPGSGGTNDNTVNTNDDSNNDDNSNTNNNTNDDGGGSGKNGNDSNGNSGGGG